MEGASKYQVEEGCSLLQRIVEIVSVDHRGAKKNQDDLPQAPEE
jgi:hypothetical protein